MMRVLMMGALACVLLGACTQTPAPLTGAALIERGKYLTEAIGGCNDCHTPMTPQGPDMSRSLQGADLTFQPMMDMPWAPHAPALAGIPAHFTEAQFAEFLQTGVRPDGSRPLPPMPHYRFNAEDARAVAAYVASVQPAPTQ